MAKEDLICEVCGKVDSKIREGLCRRHHSQVKEFSFVIDDAQEIKENEILVHNEFCELVIIDTLTEEIIDRIEFDIEDIDWIKPITWYKGFEGVIGKDIEGRIVNIQNVITGTLDKVIFKDKNYKNCRKSNLEIKKINKKKKRVIVDNKDKNKVIVELVGKSKEQVTGSANLVTYPIGNGEYKKILVEFGGHQGNGDLYTEMLMNKEIIDSVPCSEIDEFFVLHSHIDHVFCSPALIPNGFDGRVICNNENKELLTPMLLDSAYIINKNIASINKKKHRMDALYTESDVYLLMNRVETFSMNKVHKLNDCVSFEFLHAGHILGSCQLLLHIRMPSGQIKDIHITSDLGSKHNKQPFVKPMDVVKSSHFSLFEATYNDLDRGFSTRKEVVDERNEFKKFLKDELKNNRSCLIGVFAQARQQSMMSFLYDNFKNDKKFNYTIYIDGVLGNKISNVYQSVLEGEEKEYFREMMAWERFSFIDTYERSQEVALNKDETKIILASSGMFSGGRVLNHVKTMVENKKNTIVLAGYQGQGTLGYELQRDDNKTVKIESLEYRKNCKIHRLTTWSSHIMGMENIKYMSQIKTPLIVIHHSNENKYEFRDIIESELRKRNNTAKIVCASDENNIFYV